MKSKLFIGLVTALSVTNLVLSVVAPASLITSLANVLLWIALICMCLGMPFVEVMLPGRGLIQALVASLAGKFFGVSSPYGRWILWLMVIVLLVSTGSLAALVFYLITMVIIRVLRLMFTDSVTACRA